MQVAAELRRATEAAELAVALGGWVAQGGTCLGLGVGKNSALNERAGPSTQAYVVRIMPRLFCIEPALAGHIEEQREGLAAAPSARRPGAHNGIGWNAYLYKSAD